ncbi:MAG: ABC transporter substrate-binding protein [Chlorobium sp.]|nr:MAG: ABC transporter substrate-binding protein [Chlorobium sp.]
MIVYKGIRKAAVKYQQEVACWILLMFFAICSQPLSSLSATPLKKASLILLWSPQSQFAGYYVALEKGIYQRHGIDLTILKGGPGVSPVLALQQGDADFAVLWLTTAFGHRVNGKRLVNVAQIIQRSSMMLISKKTSGIRTINDMNGKKVGLWQGDLSIPPHTLFDKYGISVREIPQSNTVNLFLRGGIDVTSAMWYNEYHVLLNSGVDADELNTIFLQEQGMTFPEDGLYTLEKTVQKDPALVDGFVRASLEGWQYAFAHPDEALDIVIKNMRQAQVPANRTHQKWMLERMKDLTVSDKNEFGTLKPQDYEAVGKIMRNQGRIKSYPDYATFTWRSDARK